MTISAGRVFVVDDNVEVRHLLETYLHAEGFEVTALENGEALRAALLVGGAPDVVVLDLGLPGEDGLSLTRFLREHHHAGILIASGKGDTLDRVIGLEVGADDYLAKPFDLRELLARVRSLMRRARQHPERAEPAPDVTSGDLRRFEGWCIDLAARRLVDSGGNEVELSTGEFNLLRELALRPNQVLSRDELMERLHGREAGPFDRSIDVQISRLRRKIELDPERPTLIKSVRGVGYMLASGNGTAS